MAAIKTVALILGTPPQERPHPWTDLAATENENEKSARRRFFS